MQWYPVGILFVAKYTGGPVSSIKENGIELTKKASVSVMVAGSFFHDKVNQRVYIWPAGSDSPNTNGKTYIFYTWIGFCDTGEADFEIQGEDSIFYYPVLDTKRIPPFTMQIPALFIGQAVTQFGNIKIAWPEWTFYNLNNYIWVNSSVYIKYGESGDAYGSYKTAVVGLIKRISPGETGMDITIKDIRERLYTSIPPDRYSQSDFPYLDDDMVDEPRAVLVGEKENIKPACIDTINFKYEITQTSFDLRDFEMESIEAVYKAGVLLSTPADYSTDLPNGRFTLTVDPGTDEITCDATGLKIKRNFTTNTYSDLFTSNIADITFFYLNILQKIEAAYLKESTFLTLQSWASYVECADYLNVEIDFIEKLKELQPTGTFHLLPTTDERLEVIPYSRSEAPDAQIDNKWFNNFQVTRNPDTVLTEIDIRYNRSPIPSILETEGGESLGDFSHWVFQNPGAGYKYQTKKRGEFRTIINNVGDASNASLLLSALHSAPEEKITFKTNYDAIDWGLMKKIGITYSYFKDRIKQHLYEEDSFFITKKTIKWDGQIDLELRKDIAVIAGQPIDDHNFNHVQDHNLNEMQT